MNEERKPEPDFEFYFDPSIDLYRMDYKQNLADLVMNCYTDYLEDSGCE